MILYSAITGSESLAYQNLVSFTEVSCYLEDHIGILTEILEMGRETPEYFHLSTLGFATHLRKGQINVIQSLFVQRQFQKTINPDFQVILNNRIDYVPKVFFNNTINDVLKISTSLDAKKYGEDMENIRFKEISERKYLCIALLMAAKSISENADIGMKEMPTFDNLPAFDSYIDMMIGKVKKAAEGFPENIMNQDFFLATRNEHIQNSKN